MVHGSEPALPESFYCVLQLPVTFLVVVDGGIESFIESKSRETLYLGTVVGGELFFGAFS